MTCIAHVALHWLATPRGSRFVLPARFSHQTEDWTSDAWSLVVTPEGQPDQSGNQMATVKFLMPNAPQEWLSTGTNFTLFEGRLALAEGSVMDVAINQ